MAKTARGAVREDARGDEMATRENSRGGETAFSPNDLKGKQLSREITQAPTTRENPDVL